MKIICLLLMLCLFFKTPAAFSQEFIQDSVLMGADFTSDVYYNFDSHTVKKYPYNNWDISIAVGAFALDGTPAGVSLRLNEARGLSLHQYPDGDTSSWLIYDTTGIDSWPVLHNRFDSWDNGAFNITRDPMDLFDFGWGDYGFVFTNHAVVGDSLYVLRFADNTYKKLKIAQLKSSVFYIEVMNMDNSDPELYLVTKADFPGKDFAYLDISSDSVFNREPDLNKWQLCFATYNEVDSTEDSRSNRVGVLTQRTLKTEEFRNADPDSVVFDSLTGTQINQASSNISTIGHDWKYYDTTSTSFKVEDSLYYVVYTQDGFAYQLVFTDISSATGLVKFKYRYLGKAPTGITPIKSWDIHVYPNPVSDLLHIDMKDGKFEKLSVYSIQGKKILELDVKYKLWLDIDVNSLLSGSYFVRLEGEGMQATQKFNVIH